MVLQAARRGTICWRCIPGRAADGAFVQLIDSSGTRNFPMPDFYALGDTVRTGDCLFSPRGIRVSLPGVEGALRYEGLTPLRSDIMGPFAHLPMQCRHGVVSMSHRGKRARHGCGRRSARISTARAGYCEKDSGRSFPRSYLWLQCNDFGGFPSPLSVMVGAGAHSVSRVLLHGLSGGCDVRRAGIPVCDLPRGSDSGLHVAARASAAGSLDFGIRPFAALRRGRVMRAVSRADVSASRESCDARLRVRLSSRGSLLLDALSPRATCEVVGEG